MWLCGFPRLQINSIRSILKDGPFYSCAGGASAFDLSLSLIEEDFGRQIALRLAREFVVSFETIG